MILYALWGGKEGEQERLGEPAPPRRAHRCTAFRFSPLRRPPRVRVFAVEPARDPAQHVRPRLLVPAPRFVPKSALSPTLTLVSCLSLRSRSRSPSRSAAPRKVCVVSDFDWSWAGADLVARLSLGDPLAGGEVVADPCSLFSPTRSPDSSDQDTDRHVYRNAPRTESANDGALTENSVREQLRLRGPRASSPDVAPRVKEDHAVDRQLVRPPPCLASRRRRISDSADCGAARNTSGA